MMDNVEMKAAIEKRMMMNEKAFSLSEEERMHICDMGFYNDVIRGYLIKAMENADFEKKEISRALRGLHHAFDDLDAMRAEKIYLKR
jgi:hypothetical protein